MIINNLEENVELLKEAINNFNQELNKDLKDKFNFFIQGIKNIDEYHAYINPTISFQKKLYDVRFRRFFISKKENLTFELKLISFNLAQYSFIDEGFFLKNKNKYISYSLRFDINQEMFQEDIKEHNMVFAFEKNNNRSRTMPLIPVNILLFDKHLEYSGEVLDDFFNDGNPKYTIMLSQIVDQLLNLLKSFGYGGEQFVKEYKLNKNKVCSQPYSVADYIFNPNKKDMIRNKRKDLSVKEVNKYSPLTLTMLRKFKRKYNENSINKIKTLLFNYLDSENEEERNALENIINLDPEFVYAKTTVYSAKSYKEQIEKICNNIIISKDYEKIIRSLLNNAEISDDITAQLRQINFLVRDYLNLCKNLKLKPITGVSYNRLIQEHDNLAKKLNYERFKERKLKKIKYKKEKFETIVKAFESIDFVPLLTNHEFAFEGMIQGNCVGSYDVWQEIGDVCIFKGKIDYTRYTVEIRYSKTEGYTLEQMMAKNNSAASPVHRQILLDVINSVNNKLFNKKKIKNFVEQIGVVGMRGSKYILSEKELLKESETT